MSSCIDEKIEELYTNNRSKVLLKNKIELFGKNNYDLISCKDFADMIELFDQVGKNKNFASENQDRINQAEEDLRASFRQAVWGEVERHNILGPIEGKNSLTLL